MGSIVQSGAVTPGHRANWVTDGVLGDGGPPLVSNKVIGRILMADFNTISDQPIILSPSINAFQLTTIIVTNASIPLTAAFGGFYPLSNKAGTPLVASSQGYSALTTANILLQPTLTTYALTTRFSANVLTSGWQLYFSLSTPQGIAATGDIYVTGIDLSA